MPKLINVSLPERVRLMDIIGAQEAPGVAAQRELIRLLDAIEFSPDEQSHVGLKIDATAGFISWDPGRAEGVRYDLRLTDNQAALLAAILGNDGGRYRVSLRPRADDWAVRVYDVLKGDAA